jgi:hypothetical protein
MEKEKPICIIEVNENLRRVRFGEPLTRPLRDLNKNCHFKEKYYSMFNLVNEDEIAEERRRKKREYDNSPKGKALRERWLEKNKNRIRRMHKIYYKKNKEKISARNKKYRRENREKIRLQNRTRHRIKNNIPRWKWRRDD